VIPLARRTIHWKAALHFGLITLGVLAFDTPSSMAAGIRYAPMPEAPRSLHLSLTTNLHLAFDTERLRIHTAWTGLGLNLEGTPHTGNKTPFICEPLGEPFHTARPVVTWSVGGEASAPTNTTFIGHQFVSWSKSDTGVTLNYRVGEGSGRVEIEETLRPLAGIARGFIRIITVTTGDQDAWYAPVAEFIDNPEIRRPGNGTIAIRRANNWLVIDRHGVPGAATESSEPLRVETNRVRLSYATERTRGGDSERVEVQQSGSFVRVLHRFSARTRQQVTFAIAEVPDLPDDPAELGKRVRVAIQPMTPMDRPEARPAVFAPPPEPASANRGEDSYAIESFPLPPEVKPGVTGMDWLPNGDLAVCTWRGEVWIVEQAAGDPARARYRLFAEGLNEPLGLALVGGDIVVAQKPELTRLRDTDGDGQADRFECLNDDWHFTGNYHAFTFGPAVDADGSFLLGFCGQRARWDVAFASWLVRITPDGSRLEPIAGGLRAPNGIGFFGSDRDVFVTDNQGNWIGACKLNHVRPGRTYGYPAARPATRDQWDHPAGDFDPPVVWFPRKLAPSAAGFATIPESGFGPFGGQLVVADFQNATVLRVALEKVNDRWQGAVFPFLKGFGSGANRVLFDRSGRLYVGGVKNQAWPSAGPFEQALERVTFTGKVPFEIQHVNARPDGFELTFTEPVNREFAGDSDSYSVSQFNFRHHQEYGSPEFDHDGRPGSATAIEISAAEVSVDGLRVRLKLRGWKPGYVTRVVASALESDRGQFLRSDEFYYTLNETPAG
jgi:glucose/arabinose dehydrogenase